jgi:nicotinamide-nucleotide amidase
MFPEAAQLVDQFRENSWRIAFAESCTCGMAAAMIGGVAGASDVFCGSAVTYRASVKSDWLGVDPKTVREFTAESQQTTDEMARCVIRRTRETDWGAAITGHLGPHAPAAIDGHIFVSLARRRAVASDDPIVSRHEFVLAAKSRGQRQGEAARTLIA